MAKIFNRAWMDTATTGTGTITLGSARTGYATFAEAGIADGDIIGYTIIDGDDFEIGYGTYTSSGTTLARTAVSLSKISGVAGTSKINLSGNATVFISARKEDIQPSEQTLVDGASIDWNLAISPIAKVTLGGNRTLNAPTGLRVGYVTLTVLQDGTGSRTLTWNAVFKWPGGVAPVLSTAASARDLFSFYCDGTNLYGTYMNGLA